ncbi:MAG: hypothetical protein E5W27_01210 [Mesorhizobium sp.]|nr:MAG: hypothetical protein E5W27_01210 [Mesorhizobium sp.]
MVAIDKRTRDLAEAVVPGRQGPSGAFDAAISPGPPAKTLWSNAGNVARRHRCRALLAARIWPDGHRNELFEPARCRQGRHHICCR